MRSMTGIVSLETRSRNSGFLSGEGRLREIEHRLLQLVVRRENTWRIGIDDLHIVGIYDTHDAVAGRLGFGGNDRNPLSDERIHQCRFSHVGITYDVYKSGFMHIIYC